MTQFIPYLSAGAAQIAAMDKSTPEAAYAKAVAQMRYNANFKYNRGA